MATLVLDLFGTLDRSVAETPNDAGDSSLMRGTSDHVHVVRIERPDGEHDTAVVVVVISRGYHVNANPASFDYLIPTALHLDKPAPLHVDYPAPVRFKPKFTDQTIMVYEETIRITAEFAPGTLAARSKLTGNVTAQACTDEICFPPADLPLPGG